MNRIFSIALALLALAFSAVAQVGPNTITLSTNRVTAATTNSTAGTGFFVGNQRTVNILLTAYATNAAAAGGVGDTNGAASSFTLRMDGSMDGSTYFSNGTNWDLVFYPTGTNTHTVYRQLDSTGVQYFRQGSMMLTTTNNVFFPSATYWYK